MYVTEHIRKKSTILKSALFIVFLIASVSLYAQTDKKFIRKGNREYEKNKYPESEISYRKAIDKNKQSPDAVFNTGDALYKQNKFEDAGKQFIESTGQTDNKLKKSDGLYNLGNSLLKANKFPESIDAYKNSLKLNPRNAEAKYNLAYAADQLKKQQEQQKNKQGKDKQDNKDNEKNKNKDQNKDQKDQNDKNKDQQNKKNDQNKNQDQQQQQQGQQISKEDAQRLLNSLANDEKNVQERVKLAKAVKAKVRAEKNW
jgi:tetratricopeptide (TPR) repeat protein